MAAIEEGNSNMPERKEVSEATAEAAASHTVDAGTQYELEVHRQTRDAAVHTDSTGAARKVDAVTQTFLNQSSATTQTDVIKEDTSLCDGGQRTQRQSMIDAPSETNFTRPNSLLSEQSDSGSETEKRLFESNLPDSGTSIKNVMDTAVQTDINSRGCLLLIPLSNIEDPGSWASSACETEGATAFVMVSEQGLKDSWLSGKFKVSPHLALETDTDGSRQGEETEECEEEKDDTSSESDGEVEDDEGQSEGHQGVAAADAGISGEKKSKKNRRQRTVGRINNARAQKQGGWRK